MTVAAMLLVIPDAILAFAWLRLSVRRCWLAAWLASWTGSVIALAAMVLYLLAGNVPGVVVTSGVALAFALARFLFGTDGPRYASTGRHHHGRG